MLKPSMGSQVSMQASGRNHAGASVPTSGCFDACVLYGLTRPVEFLAPAIRPCRTRSAWIAMTQLILCVRLVPPSQPSNHPIGQRHQEWSAARHVTTVLFEAMDYAYATIVPRSILRGWLQDCSRLQGGGHRDAMRSSTMMHQ